jgi:hypothetical protein
MPFETRGTVLLLRRYKGHAALEEEDMDFAKGALLWLLGVPLPIILLIALFWHH